MTLLAGTPGPPTRIAALGMDEAAAPAPNRWRLSQCARTPHLRRLRRSQ
jgi:hypothetical protein